MTFIIQVGEQDITYMYNIVKITQIKEKVVTLAFLSTSVAVWCCQQCLFTSDSSYGGVLCVCNVTCVSV